MNDFLKFIQRILNLNNERFTIASFLNIFENSISRTILLITILSLAIFLLNAIVWTLGEALKRNFLKNNKTTKDPNKGKNK